jgi:hypothetical protein
LSTPAAGPAAFISSVLLWFHCSHSCMKFSCVQRASSANCSWGRGHGVAPRREGDRLTVRRGAPRTLEIDSGPGHGRLRADADIAGANDPDRTHNAAARRRDAGQRVQEPRRGPARVLRHRAGPEGSTGHQGNPARLTPPATLSSCQRLPLRSLAHAARRRRRRLRSPDPCGPWLIPLLIRRAGRASLLNPDGRRPVAGQLPVAGRARLLRCGSLRTTALGLVAALRAGERDPWL